MVTDGNELAPPALAAAGEHVGRDGIRFSCLRVEGGWLEGSFKKEVRIVAVEVKEWTRSEIVAVFEEESQARTGLPAQKLIRSYRDDALEDPAAVSDLNHLLAA